MSPSSFTATSTFEKEIDFGREMIRCQPSKSHFRNAHGTLLEGFFYLFSLSVSLFGMVLFELELLEGTVTRKIISP